MTITALQGCLAQLDQGRLKIQTEDSTLILLNLSALEILLPKFQHTVLVDIERYDTLLYMQWSSLTSFHPKITVF